NPGPAMIPTGLRTIELAGDKPPVPGEDGVWLGRAGHLLQTFAPESFADLSKRASLRIRQGSRAGKCARRTRFSAAKYSFWSSSSWFTSPVTYASRRAQ